jgi:hypothetical protein
LWVGLEKVGGGRLARLALATRGGRVGWKQLPPPREDLEHERLLGGVHRGPATTATATTAAAAAAAAASGVAVRGGGRCRGATGLRVAVCREGTLEVRLSGPGGGLQAGWCVSCAAYGARRRRRCQVRPPGGATTATTTGTAAAAASRVAVGGSGRRRREGRLPRPYRLGLGQQPGRQRLDRPRGRWPAHAGRVGRWQHRSTHAVG